MSLGRTAWRASIWLGLLVGATVSKASDRPDVIYGDDNRLDLNSDKVAPAMRALAKSTVILTDRVNVQNAGNADEKKLKADQFGQMYNLCADEPFRTQPMGGWCSGFLVAPDIIVTAGHCVTSQGKCESTAFVFDFAYDRDGRDPTIVKTNDVYYCKQLIAQKLAGEHDTDYAVVRLSRKVEDREPVQFRKTDKVSDHANLTVIGYPAGIPVKVSGGANVRNNTNSPYFVANLDTYGGNSGSAVFNTDTLEVEGILVRGENDFVMENGCRKSNRCANDACRGEDVTRATEFAAFVTDDPDGDDPTPVVDTPFLNLNASIPDDNQTGITEDFYIPTAGKIVDLGVAVEIKHNYVGDLQIILQHPDGTQAVIFNRNGSAQHDLNQTFGLGGSFVPELTRFKNKDAQGTWKLIVKDLAKGDSGTLNSVVFKVKAK